MKQAVAAAVAGRAFPLARKDDFTRSLQHTLLLWQIPAFLLTGLLVLARPRSSHPVPSPAGHERAQPASAASPEGSQQSMQRRGLILDFAGVLTSDIHAAFAAFCTREGLPPGAVSRALRDTVDGRDALAAAECGRISQRELETVLAGLTGAGERDLLARACADLRPCDLVLDLVTRVRARGIPAAVLSNSLGRGSYDLYQGYDLGRRFDAVVISHQVGLRKPDPAIYRLAAARICVPATACVFADDTAANLQPARALGMTAVHFTNPATGAAKIEHSLNHLLAGQQ